ncbi:MAG: phytanoyl-CoA dioxygenase [Hyphomicrobiales bacterium]|nr:MAG: phytanoyl-CoA dioxygenase [Hyphomicrobiales bacterium]
MPNMPVLSPAQITSFIADGFVRIDNAFTAETAADARAILWRDAGVDPDNPASWTKPVIRLGGYAQQPFRDAANSPVLISAYDQLVGPGRWAPPQGLGTFPIRFPSPDNPGDAGWHVDASIPGDDPADFFSVRVNIASKGRALLMLFLFTETGPDDAPTRIRIGSHQRFARHIADRGERGVSLRQLLDEAYDWDEGAAEVLATGSPGTVYLCHPFLIHSAQPHRGTRPRIMAQPPLFPRGELALERSDSAYSPVEIAIRNALGR